MSERSFSQVSFPIVVAHRGAGATHPENTIGSFEAAVEAGAEAVEFDVRLTRDGVPVVMHDADVDRTTDGTGPVMALGLKEVRALRVAGTSERVPTLEEALGHLSGRAAVDIEIKNDPGEPGFLPDPAPLAEAVVAAIDAVAFEGPVLVSSFDTASIAATRRLAPGIATGLLTGLDTQGAVALSAAMGQGHAWVLPFVTRVIEAGGAFPAAVHDPGLLLGVWIVDDPPAAVGLMRAGVDAVATNDPAAIVAARREAFGR